MIERPNRDERFEILGVDDVVEFPYDDDKPDEEPLSIRVVDSVAAATGRRPIDLDPLYNTLEPDALDSLYPPQGRGGVVVSFRYEGTYVEVSGNGDVVVALEADAADGATNERSGPDDYHTHD